MCLHFVQNMPIRELISGTIKATMTTNVFWFELLVCAGGAYLGIRSSKMYDSNRGPDLWKIVWFTVRRFSAFASSIQAGCSGCRRRSGAEMSMETVEPLVCVTAVWWVEPEQYVLPLVGRCWGARSPHLHILPVSQRTTRRISHSCWLWYMRM